MPTAAPVLDAGVSPEDGLEDTPLDARALSKLKWRCRRGLLENDLFIARFFNRHEYCLTLGQARAMTMLMDLSDPDLLDLLLARKEPDANLGADPAVSALLAQMRSDGARAAAAPDFVEFNIPERK